MHALLSSQSPAVKFFAVFSTIVISLLAVTSGAALLGMQQVASYYDMAVPRIFEHASSLGLTAVIAAWVLHLGGLVVLLGYPSSEARSWLSYGTTVSCGLYLLFVLMASLAVFPMCGTQTLM